jgi:hypothetical protein
MVLSLNNLIDRMQERLASVIVTISIPHFLASALAFMVSSLVQFFRFAFIPALCHDRPFYRRLRHIGNRIYGIVDFQQENLNIYNAVFYHRRYYNIFFILGSQ